ncbi:MAG TPA: mechanosensitive ion channel domain-containing protein [Chitinophagaceae bacterium]|nr:mechanosensitive ion channel domain-containing protein [Chitinophagaceae bacterium]
MKLFLPLCLFILTGISSVSQVKDSERSSQKSFDSTMFADDDTLTRSDYLLSFDKEFQMLNKGNTMSRALPAIRDIIQHIDEDDSALNIIKDRLSLNERGLNVRNLQMFTILLEQINKGTRRYARELNRYDSILDSTKKQIFDLRDDTVVRYVYRDSILRVQFKPQLQKLRRQLTITDSIIKYVNVLIDNTLARTSDNFIIINELQVQAAGLSETIASRAFTKERRYLWERRPAQRRQSVSAQIKKNLASEKKITQYYFSHTPFQLNLLLLCGLVFFFWVFFNFRSLKKRDKLATLQTFRFQYINELPFFASLIFILNIAPLFDLNAPVVYIDAIEFLLMIVLTFSFRKRHLKKLFYLWIIFLVLFLLSLTRYLGLPFYINRWLWFILNCLSFLLGIYVLLRFKKRYSKQKILILTVGIYTLFNFLALICNLFGRVTLLQIFSSTATYAVIQTIALIVFKQSVTEVFILQIQSSRIRKDYPEKFESNEVVKGTSRLVVFCSVIIWLIVFITNLNLFQFLSGKIIELLSTTRVIGSFSFTYGGMILFLSIIYIAHFLQKYVAYFFGDIGDDASFNNKSHRSRLLITRLVLLASGFLLAIAASGFPVDRITVILGALSVGVGLGLQSIVNNFVSGIVLIFDRTVRIGDIVEIGDRKGRVKEISVRSSTLLTPEGAEVIIPNGNILAQNIVNWTLSNSHIRLQVSYSVDTFVLSEDTRKEITEIIVSSPQVLAQKEPEIFIDTKSHQSTLLKIYFWCKDINKSEVTRSEVYTSICKYLEAKGTKIL